MTRSELQQYWRNVSFWQRLIIECGFCIGVGLILDVIFRQSADLGWAIIGGATWGLWYAIIDHAYFARKRRKHQR